MRGAEPDLEKIEGIVNGTIKSGSGDGIFGFSLLGGIFDTIGSMLDRDGNGSMWSSTVLNPDGTGKEVDIFGNTIRTFTEQEMKSFGELVDGRWQGNLENPYKPKGSKGSGGSGGTSSSTSSSTSSKIPKTAYEPMGGKKRYERDSTYGAAEKSMDIRGGATRKVRQGQKDRSQQNLSRAYGDSSSMASGKFDTGDKGIAAEKATKITNRVDSSGRTQGQSGYKSKLRERQDAKKQKQKDEADAYTVGAKGMLVPSVPRKKKPTKGKTLVTKRS